MDPNPTVLFLCHIAHKIRDFYEVLILTASLSDTPISNSQGCKQEDEGKFGGVDRVLKKFPECLNNTYDL